MATLKQKKVLDILSGNVGMPIGQAMLQAGYAELTSKTPQRLTDSKGWEELLEKYLPDKDLAKVHKELLNKKETVIIHSGKDSKVELTEQPHTDAKAALDMGYKLKAKYAPEKHLNTNFNLSLSDLFDKANDN